MSIYRVTAIYYFGDGDGDIGEATRDIEIDDDYPEEPLTEDDIHDMAWDRMHGDLCVGISRVEKIG